MKTLANKSVLITGAGSGIGKSTAELFAKQGAHLMLSDIRYRNIEEVAKEIKNKRGVVSCYPADISKLQDVKSLIDYTLGTYKSIDVLVNNAGIMDDFAAVEEVTDESWNKIMGVNLNGPFFTC